MYFLQKSSKFINIIRSFMLIIHNIIKPVILPSNDFKNRRNEQIITNSLPNLRKPSGKMNTQQTSKKLVGDQRNSLQKRGIVFDNEFKKKYYSVCSQMLKIKHDWKNDVHLKGEENITRSQGFQQVRLSIKKQEKLFVRPRIRSKQIKNEYFKQTFKDKNRLKIDQKNYELQIDKICLPFRKSHVQQTNQLQKQVIYCQPNKPKSFFQSQFKNNLKKLIHIGKQNSDLKGWINDQDTEIHDFTYLF